jgi:hypothetical protein
MTQPVTRHTGGCLCGALRYEAEGEPLYAGYCFCTDCRKASGSGFIPFLGLAAAGVRLIGPVQSHTSTGAHGGPATRNMCPTCGGLVFGGEVGVSDSYTVYAGSLDDPSVFKPTVAIFNARRPAWAPLPEGLEVHQGNPFRGVAL